MAGNGAIGRDRRHLAKLLEPADEAPVDDRDTVDKEQVREPKGARLLVENRQIVVGVGRAMRPQCETPSAQVEIEPGGNKDGRRYHLAALCLIAESLAKSPQVIVASLREGARQFDMANEIGMVVAESCGTEDVVGMDVSQDHISDRPIGEC